MHIPSMALIAKPMFPMSFSCSIFNPRRIELVGRIKSSAKRFKRSHINCRSYFFRAVKNDSLIEATFSHGAIASLAALLRLSSAYRYVISSGLLSLGLAKFSFGTASRVASISICLAFKVPFLAIMAVNTANPPVIMVPATIPTHVGMSLIISHAVMLPSNPFFCGAAITNSEVLR